MALELTRHSRLLFIGDSITDCGRRDDSEEMGSGYVRMVRDWLLAARPADAPVVLNRGIGGNRILDLEKRWDRDVIALRPDVLSVFIGINDVWHGLSDVSRGVPVERFIEGYRDVLNRTRQALPACKLVLCEPSVLWLPEPADANDRLKPYVQAVHQVAGEFNAVGVVRLHEAFTGARQAREDVAWTTDGAHPSSAGHMLIARTWMEATGVL